jgi:hypothetical protein
MKGKIVKEVVGQGGVFAGVTERCRLSLLTNSALVYKPKRGGGGQRVQLRNEAQMKFGDHTITPNLTYGSSRPHVSLQARKIKEKVLVVR